MNSGRGDVAETFRFDVRAGKIAVPPQTESAFNWCLSPDGSKRAIILYGSSQGKIQLRSASMGQTSDLVVKGLNVLIGVNWSTDAKWLLVSRHNFEQDSALSSRRWQRVTGIRYHPDRFTTSQAGSPSGGAWSGKWSAGLALLGKEIA